MEKIKKIKSRFNMCNSLPYLRENPLKNISDHNPQTINVEEYNKYFHE